MLNLCEISLLFRLDFSVTHQIAVASEALEIGDGQQLRRPVLLRSAAGQTQAEALGS